MEKIIPNKGAYPNQKSKPFWRMGAPCIKWLKKPFGAALSFVLPQTCLLCRVSIAHKAGEASLCPQCWSSLTPLSNENSHVELMLYEEHFDKFSAPFLYNEAAGALVQKLKYNDGLHLAHFMANQMVPFVPEGIDVIVPVPLHGKRLKQRKYNQAVALIWHLSQKTGHKTNLVGLKRIRQTSSQVGQSAKIRRRQLQDAFYAEAQIFAGLNVLLVDDVCTTGSTAHWCAQALKNAGALQIHVLTFAYVEPKLSF